uniref:Uncharacterized protein n=1 Tax=Zea mays TaxID=4577 RepID=B4FJZ3_MAIZE|nr:unknown [Zea mays]ACR37447.1 unknown [Zea mays]
MMIPVYLFHLMILQRHCQSLRWLMTTLCLLSMKTQALRFYCKEGSSPFFLTMVTSPTCG